MASVYTSDQIEAFLRHIQIPNEYYPANKPVLNAAFLNALHVHTISTIPYENLTLHYSPTRQISVEPHHSFQKIIGDGRGRGGYCMEISIMFNHILRGLGFKAYTAGVRIRRREDGVPSGEFIGW
jgi:arylamine N-acetyltransferase